MGEVQQILQQFLYLFHGIRLLSIKSNTKRKVRTYLTNFANGLNVLPKQNDSLIINVFKIIGESFILNNSVKKMTWVNEQISIDGIVFEVPIFAVGQTSSGVGLLLYDQYNDGIRDHDYIRSWGDFPRSLGQPLVYEISNRTESAFLEDVSFAL